MKKKVLALVLVVALVAALTVGLVACNRNPGEEINEVFLKELEGVEKPDYSKVEVPANFKIGLICLHDNNSTYDKNFIEAFERTQKAFGLSDEQALIVYNVPEDDKCKKAAEDLVDQGCSIIFADSFKHEAFLKPVAIANPEVEFCHATGDSAHVSNIPNLHNAFASIYEGRFLAGVAAGMKLNEMGETHMGYVGAFPYAEVKSGYTAFYLGAKLVCPKVTMEVQFTGSWYDETKEKNTANALIGKGAKLISQHADSMGAPNACEIAGIPNVSYNGSTIKACQDSFIVSSKINWTPYFNYCVAQKIAEQKIDTDWVGTLKTDSVQLSGINADVMAKGTVEKLEEVRAALVAGTMKVFDLSTFTVSGKKLASDEMADVDPDPNFTPDTVAIKTIKVGEKTIEYFAESELRAAPYFAIDIDGITVNA